LSASAHSERYGKKISRSPAQSTSTTRELCAEGKMALEDSAQSITTSGALVP
jgi:hypothetical protein